MANQGVEKLAGMLELLEEYRSEHREVGQCDAEPCEKCRKVAVLAASTVVGSQKDCPFCSDGRNEDGCPTHGPFYKSAPSPRPLVVGASPVCLDCNAVGMQNCSHFDNCDGKWVYKPLPQTLVVTCTCAATTSRELCQMHGEHRKAAEPLPQPAQPAAETPRTKAKIKENLGLLMDFIRKKYGSADEDVEQILYNALSWTADDVANQLAQPVAPPKLPAELRERSKKWPHDDTTNFGTPPHAVTDGLHSHDDRCRRCQLTALLAAIDAPEKASQNPAGMSQGT